MGEILSIKGTDDSLKVEANKSDYTASAVTFLAPFVSAFSAAGLLGAGAPVIASILGNAIAFGIPNRKMDRVVIGLNLLADKLMFLGKDLDEEKLKTDEFMDLLEDGVLQFARALTPERREYIANLLKNGLTDEQLDHLGKKKLLSLLNELNDAEIIILHYYSLETEELKESMRKMYPFLPSKSSTDDKRWRSEDPNVQLYNSYRAKVISLDLVYIPGPDYKTTNLANTLLRYIHLMPNAH